MPAGYVGYVAGIYAFAIAAGTLAAAKQHEARRLHLVERKRHDLEQYLSTAQQLERFWTWEFDYRLNVWKWNDPYGELKARKFEHIESWLHRVHPEDRERCRTALAQAARKGELALEFRVRTPSGQMRVLAKGLAPGERAIDQRLLGVSVQLPDPAELQDLAGD